MAGLDPPDVAAAADAFRSAIDSGHADLAPLAANNLGMLLAGKVTDLDLNRRRRHHESRGLGLSDFLQLLGRVLQREPVAVTSRLRECSVLPVKVKAFRMSGNASANARRLLQLPGVSGIPLACRLLLVLRPFVAFPTLPDCVQRLDGAAACVDADLVAGGHDRLGELLGCDPAAGSCRQCHAGAPRRACVQPGRW